MLEWFRLPWKKSEMEDLDVVELHLEKAFKPVQPNPNFVHELRRGLENIPVLVSPTSNSNVFLYLALTITSLLSGVALIGILVWAILTMIGRSSPREKKAVTEPQPALYEM